MAERSCDNVVQLYDTASDVDVNFVKNGAEATENSREQDRNDGYF